MHTCIHTEGRVVFFGPANQCAQYFLDSSFGFKKMQSMTNPADFIIAVAGMYVCKGRCHHYRYIVNYVCMYVYMYVCMYVYQVGLLTVRVKMGNVFGNPLQSICGKRSNSRRTIPTSP